VRAYAEAGGYSNVKLVDDEPDDLILRVTARTPNGRGGRTVAFIDAGDDYNFDD
jgi:hypothetical protein